jgi:hypothetical protein
MKTKEEIVKNWLPRYTGKSIETFGKYFLLTNYMLYVELFAKWNKATIEGRDKNMPSATADGITTACMVMGKDRSIEFIKSNNMLQGYLVYSDDNGNFMTWKSEGLKKWINEKI